MGGNFEAVAHQFCGYIKEIAEKPENLNNLECYLSYHFAAWMKKYADTPAGITAELREFARMEL